MGRTACGCTQGNGFTINNTTFQKGYVIQGGDLL